MTALEKYSELIEKSDNRLQNVYKDIILSYSGMERASMGSYELREALSNMIPVSRMLINLGKKVLLGFDEKPENAGVVMTVGWSIIRPLVSEGYLSLQRQSQFMLTESDVKANAFKSYESFKRSSKKKGDWTTYMFTDGTKEPGFLDDLGNEVGIAMIDEKGKIQKNKPLEWEGYDHVDYGTISSRPSKRAKQLFNSKTGANTLKAINKLQGTAFFINNNLLDRLINEKKEVEAYIREKSETLQSGSSKIYSFRRMIDLAIEHRDGELYSAVNQDFRGRMYYTANYLNRSSSDWAKGLLGVEPEAIGVNGYNNLLVAAVDFRDKGVEAKMSRADKLAIADNDVDEFIAIANGANFLTYTDDKGNIKNVGEPAQFLAVCCDIRNADQMGSNYAEYKSGVLLSRDASQSGPMLMGIATQDEMAMKYTNVLQDDKPHDLYTYMGGCMLDSMKKIDVEDIVDIDPMPDTLFERNLWCSKNDKQLRARAKRDFLNLFSTEPSSLRSWAKYPLMLFGYSAREYCIANDLYNKMYTKHDWLTSVHVIFIAELFYEACKQAIPEVHKFMEGMQTFGKLVKDQDKDVEVISAYSGFPFVQQYRKFDSRQKRLFWTDKESMDVQLRYRIKTDVKDTNRIKSGTPANLVHSIDSDLLKMVVNEFDGPIATNHDAFFTTAARVSDLDVVLRECTYKMGTEYNLVENAISPYGITVEDLGITIKEINPNFNPMANEFCYS
jgi:hypothetical protein